MKLRKPITQRMLRNAKEIKKRGYSLKHYAQIMNISYWGLSRKLTAKRRKNEDS